MYCIKTVTDHCTAREKDNAGSKDSKGQGRVSSFASASSKVSPRPQPPPPHASALVPASAVSKYMVKWRSNISESLKALVGRDEAVRTVPIGGQADARQISLLLSTSNVKKSGSDEPELQDVRVLFVYWLPMKHLVGKPVPVDGESGLVSNVPNFLKTEEKFGGKNTEIIHPATGVFMRKARDDREYVPKEIMRLKNMFDVALSPCTGFEEWSCCPCGVCGSDDIDPLSSDQHARQVKPCSLCLMHLHDSCEDSLANSLPVDADKRNKIMKVKTGSFHVGMVPPRFVAPERSGAQDF